MYRIYLKNELSQRLKIDFCKCTKLVSTNKFSPPIQYSLTSRKYITNKSWAAGRLKEMGEKIVEDSTELNDASKQPVITREILFEPSPKVVKIMDDIMSLNILEVNQLLRAIQVRLGFSDEEYESASNAAAASGADSTAEAVVEVVKEREAFDLKLEAVSAANKVKIIKEVRTLTGLGLKEAKELVEKAPIIVKQGIKKDKIEAIKKSFTDAGATIEII